MTKIPYTKSDFEWISWNGKQMKKLSDGYIAEKKKNYATIKAIPKEARTYENTVYTLERAEGPYADVFRKISLLGEVSPKEAIRNASHEVIVDVSSKMVDLEYDKDLYRSLLEYYEGNFKKEKKTLGKDDIKLLEEGIREYRRMGFDLPNATQKKLKTLLKKSSKLGEDFRKNINDYQDMILCSVEELEGLSETYISGLEKDDKSGKYMVSLAYPHSVPFMSQATNRIKREELANKLLKKGGKKNLKILDELVSLRAEISKILGYKHHADFRTENRMAKSGAIVEKFQDELLKKLLPVAKKDIDTLRVHAKSFGIKKLEHFDTAFISTDLKKKLYDIDPETVRQYFPLEEVMEGMLGMYGTLFGITFKKLDTKLWHKDVMLYEVSNKDKSLIGYLALDLFPREGKFGHACCMDTVAGREISWKSDQFIAPFTLIVCNFQKPQTKGKKAVPSLLSLGEVETLFHEFGHSLHMTLSNVRHESQAGANVAWDFVETPSQIMENWVWSDEVLKKLSKHYKTGEKLSAEMRKKILEGRLFQTGNMYLRQVLMGKLDFDLHTGKIKDAPKAYRAMTKKYMGIDLPEKDMLFPAGFGHLVGYDAGYYSYLWALVYACDAFSEFEKHGIFNPEIGMKWRKEVLEKGSSEDEMKLVKNFLGRAPNQKAFLKEIGV